MASQQLSCRDCGNSFEFSERDAEFYASKGFKNPSRCRDCRNKKNGGNSGSTNQRAPRATKQVWCTRGIHFEDVPETLQIDTSRDFNCQKHRSSAGSSPRPTKPVWCTGGTHFENVPLTFQIDESRDFYCRKHPKPKKQMYDAFCAGLGQWIPGHHVQVPFETDPTRPWYCEKHKPERPLYRGDRVSMRYNANGAPTGSTFGGVRRDAAGNVTGFSSKGPGGGLNHSDRLGNYTGSTNKGPGGGSTSTNKSGKITSFTDTRGNRKGPMGNNKGSSSNL